MTLAQTDEAEAEAEAEAESEAVAMFRRAWRCARQAHGLRFTLLYQAQGAQHTLKMENVFEQKILGKRR